MARLIDFPSRGRRHDSNDMVPGDVTVPESFIARGSRVGLQYVDANGALSERIIQIQSVQDPYLFAFCEMRNALRQFRIDRIEAIIDLRNGEVIDDHLALCSLFGCEPEPLGESQPWYSHGFERGVFVLDAIGDELRVLIYVSEADNQFAAREKDLLCDYIRMRCEDFAVEINNTDIAILRKWAATQHPSLLDVESALSRIAGKGSAPLQGVWNVANLMAEADGSVSDSEITALKEIQRMAQSLVR